MIYLYCLGGALLVVYQLWVHFLAVMNLQAARDDKTITPLGLKFGYVVLFVGWVLDFLGQLIPASVIFWELPRELTVSQRVKRLIENGNGWRRLRAEWVRDHCLKPFDRTGRHG